MATVMEPASIDSGLRRNDGEYGHGNGAGKHRFRLAPGMTVNMATVTAPASIASGLRRNDGEYVHGNGAGKHRFRIALE